MATTCKKCGATATGDQAFCPKCGAVIGMEAAPNPDPPPNLAATVVGQRFNVPKPKPTPPPAPPAPTKPSSASAEGAGGPAPRPEPPRDAGAARHAVVAADGKSGSKLVLLVVAGFIAVMLIGGLLLVLLYLYFGGHM